jgi:2-polyprenyl-3-methyl-5-hydroxy-6-metoxy-1,4-benzoquinol methylase
MTPPVLRRWFKERSWFYPVTKRVFGNTVYSKSYYEDVERLEGTSIEHLADWISTNLRAKTVVDIGCGPGHLMDALRRRGAEVFGVDVATAALSAARKKGLRVDLFDLTHPGVRVPGAPFDLAISCEVAEHLEEQFARAFVEKLTTAAPLVFLTAAEPDPSVGVGLYHVNERPNAYWIALMDEAGFALDAEATASARRALSIPEVIVYLQKPLIFRSRG